MGASACHGAPEPFYAGVVMQAPAPTATAREVVKRAVRLPTAHRFRLAWRLGWSPRVPLRARAPLLVLLVYLAIPLDIIPDFIPVIGQLDDILIAGIAAWWFLRSCPPAIALEEIERLEQTPLGRVGRLVPWLLAGLCISLLVGAGIWWLRR